MKKIVCEICGSANIVKQDGSFVCQDCGIKYSASEVKALMRETGEKQEDNGAAEPQAAVELQTDEPQDAASSVRPLSSAKIASSEWLAASGQLSAQDITGPELQLSGSSHSTKVSIFLHNAREAKKSRSWQEAYICYEHVKSEEPKNPEAVFYSAYCLVMEAFRTVPPRTVYRKAEPRYTRSYYRSGRKEVFGFHRSERSGYVRESAPVSQTPERCRMLDLLHEAIKELSSGFAVPSSDELQLTVGRMSSDILELFEKHYTSRLVSKWRNTGAGAREYAPLEQRLNRIELSFTTFLMQTAQIDRQSLYSKLAVKHCQHCLHDPHTPQQLRSVLLDTKEAALGLVRVYEPDWAPVDEAPKYLTDVVLPPDPSKFKGRFQYGCCFIIAVFALLIMSVSRLLTFSC